MTKVSYNQRSPFLNLASVVLIAIGGIGLCVGFQELRLLGLGSILLIAGLLSLMYRSKLVIDLDAGEACYYSGLISLSPHDAVSLSEVKAVHLRAEVGAVSNHQTGGTSRVSNYYTELLVEGTLPVQLSKQPEKARQIGQDLAKFLKVPLHDELDGELTITNPAT